jgi:hypothetical protein
MFIGFKKYSKNSGYGYQTIYAGKENFRYKIENNRVQ